MDDHKRLTGHMQKPSLMMAGSAMRVETNALRVQAVGSVIRVTGRVLGRRSDRMIAVQGVERKKPVELGLYERTDQNSSICAWFVNSGASA